MDIQKRNRELLDLLCKEDKKWRAFAYKITKSKDLGDEVLQEFYIRRILGRKKIEPIQPDAKGSYDSLMWTGITRLFYDMVSKKQKSLNLVSIENCYYVPDTNTNFELDDQEQEALDSLTWVEKEILERRYDKESLRDIAKECSISYFSIFRNINLSKMKVTKNKEDNEVIKKVHEIFTKNHTDTFPMWFGIENAKEFFEAVVITTKEVVDGEYRT